MAEQSNLEDRIDENRINKGRVQDRAIVIAPYSHIPDHPAEYQQGVLVVRQRLAISFEVNKKGIFDANIVTNGHTLRDFPGADKAEARRQFDQFDRYMDGVADQTRKHSVLLASPIDGMDLLTSEEKRKKRVNDSGEESLWEKLHLHLGEQYAVRFIVENQRRIGEIGVIAAMESKKEYDPQTLTGLITRMRNGKIIFEIERFYTASE